MNNLNWVSVNSSNLNSVAYNNLEKTLFVNFYNGDTYKYFDVPENIYQGLLNASSHGKYHARFIKNSFRCVKV